MISSLYPHVIQIEGLQQQPQQQQRQRNNNNNNNNIQTKPKTKTIVPQIGTARSTAIFALYESLITKTKKKNKEATKPVFAIRVLENDVSYQKLDGRDRAFSRLLLSTTERRSGQIEKILNSYIASRQQQQQQQQQQQNDDDRSRGSSHGRQQKSSDILCEAALQIGVIQILFLDVPQYAAVDETVEVLRLHPKIKVSQPQINFVNGVLRNVARDGETKLMETSILDNVDPWLAKQWIDMYGEDISNTIVSSAMSQSPIFLSVNHRRLGDDNKRINDLIEQFTNANKENISDNDHSNDENDHSISVPELLPIGCIRVPDNFGGSVSKYPGYKEGLWWVQDPSATLPAIALRNGLTNNNDLTDVSSMHVVDLCSAPGGKCAQLCSMGFGRVDAVEISERRSKSLEQNLKRLGMEDVCRVTVADGREWTVPTTNDDNVVTSKIDGILLDAPCSATGVGSRQPDVLRKNINLSELVPIQQELMVHAVDNLLPVGGVLVYATCSLLKQEGEDQIEWLLSRSAAKDSGGVGATIEVDPFQVGEIPGFDDCIDSKKGWLRVIPGTLPGSLQYCDGFFVARLRKVADK